MIEDWFLIVLAILSSYLIGSMPTAYLYGRLRGVDIRTQGSGNPGATNIARLFGIPAGVMVLLVDVGKGFVAAYWLSRWTPYPASDLIRVGCGLAAIFGHAFTPFLKFKGGKGVAATYGVLLGLAPIATIMVFIAFAGVVAGTRYISAGSLVSAFLFPLLIWLVGESGYGFSILILSIIIGLVIIILHRGNIERIIQGTENRLGRRIPVKPEKNHHG
ncbi:glycerol-3-phosphate 1-O-acyltransferase PlsY [bacterium]|nr:glycerol-3-phosphate 1-O-acyltransferase PlsY [bacterium]